MIRPPYSVEVADAEAFDEDDDVADAESWEAVRGLNSDLALTRDKVEGSSVLLNFWDRLKMEEDIVCGGSLDIAVVAEDKLEVEFEAEAVAGELEAEVDCWISSKDKGPVRDFLL